MLTGPALTGRCQCGAVAFACSGHPLGLFVCHCLECRKQSTSAFGMSVPVRRADFSLTRGTPHLWTRPTDSGNTLECAFCEACGSRLWHVRSSAPDIIGIRAGALDIALDTSTAIHIWTSRKLPGIVIPAEATQYPEEPPR
ncbi:MAG TPA: GFA family protein [Stellaceae bacterium]|jgi:hypothetical protein|nr:GFA family protein [Stellaceae bacterium]